MKAQLVALLRRAAPWFVLWLLWQLVLFESFLLLLRWGVL